MSRIPCYGDNAMSLKTLKDVRKREPNQYASNNDDLLDCLLLHNAAYVRSRDLRSQNRRNLGRSLTVGTKKLEEIGREGRKRPKIKEFQS